METSDKQFFLTFLGVTALLVIVALVILFAANLLASNGKLEAKSSAQIRIAKERIQPVGNVNWKSQANDGSESAKTELVAKADTADVEVDMGERIYGGICQSCHVSGAAGAPIVGDVEVWKPRIAAGIQVLYDAAINGKGLMAAKGGNPALSDEEVKAAVDFMVKASQ